MRSSCLRVGLRFPPCASIYLEIFAYYARVGFWRTNGLQRHPLHGNVSSLINLLPTPTWIDGKRPWCSPLQVVRDMATVDVKAFLANERCFLKYLQKAVLLVGAASVFPSPLQPECLEGGRVCHRVLRSKQCLTALQQHNTCFRYILAFRWCQRHIFRLQSNVRQTGCGTRSSSSAPATGTSPSCHSPWASSSTSSASRSSSPGMRERNHGDECYVIVFMHHLQ